MAAQAPSFRLLFEAVFLERYAALSPKERQAIDKALVYLAANPRHLSLQVHKAKKVSAKYPIGGHEVFIAYASRAIPRYQPAKLIRAMGETGKTFYNI